MINTFSSNNLSNVDNSITVNSSTESIVLSSEPTIDEYNSLALLYKSKKINKKTIYFYEKALSLRIEMEGEINTRTALAYINLSEAYVTDGLISQAILSYEKVLKIYNELFGEDSIESSSVYSALANIFFLEKELDKALRLYVKALEIRKELLGDLHPLTARSYHELGFFYAAGEEYLLALPLFEKALKTRVELFRNSHPETATSYNSLAICSYNLFQYDKAYAYLVEAIKIKELILPKRDETLLVCRKNLAEIKRELSKSKRNSFFKRVFNFS